MKKQNKNRGKLGGVIPKIARAFGDSTVDAACAWWFYQPKIPKSMQKKKK